MPQGMPNAGKSSLLRALTGAKAKVGAAPPSRARADAPACLPRMRVFLRALLPCPCTLVCGSCKAALWSHACTLAPRTRTHTTYTHGSCTTPFCVRAQVGAYAFTTLHPQLGAVSSGAVSSGDAGSGARPLILADIPGLIAGAHEDRCGRWLGPAHTGWGLRAQ